MKTLLAVITLVTVIVLAGCGDTSRPVDVAPTPTSVNCTITATPSTGSNSVYSVDVSVSAKIYGQSKAAALRRVATDLTRLADDLALPPAPPDPIKAEISNSSEPKASLDGKF